MISRAELKGRSKDQLRGRWTFAIGVILLSTILINGFDISSRMDSVYDKMNNIGIYIPFIDNIQKSTFKALSIGGGLWTVFLGGAFTLGESIFLINFVTGKNEAKVGNLFEGFKVFLKTLGMNLLIMLIVIVGVILLIVPGIIFALMYSQAFYIMAEDNTKSITECLTESREMMVGHKGEFFVLSLSFIGWYILGMLSLGIGLLWVNPYANVTYINYYLELKNEKYGEDKSESDEFKF